MSGWKKMNRRGRLMSMFMGVLLVFALVSMLVSKSIYDRQFPRVQRHDEEINAKLRYADYEEMYPRQLVGFLSGENDLQGYVYGGDQKKGLMVLSHGLGGGADSYLPQIFDFLDRGYGVFAYDSTGSFDSEGGSTRGFPQAIRDLEAALDFIGTREDLSSMPILLFGHSWGGYAAANVISTHPEVRGVISVSGANSSMEMVMEQGKRSMGPFIYTQYPFLWIYERILFGSDASRSAVEAINGSNIPILIIHGSEDEMVDPGGSAIMAHEEELREQDVRIMTLSRAGRNGHSDLFYSEEAKSYIDELNAVYSDLFDKHQGDIPYETKRAFYGEVQRDRAQELDQELMDELDAFFESCMGNE